jgi:hypothetical protein
MKDDGEGRQKVGGATPEPTLTSRAWARERGSDSSVRPARKSPNSLDNFYGLPNLRRYSVEFMKPLTMRRTLFAS